MKKLILLLSCWISSECFATSFEHKDWELACDNTRTCRVAGYSKEGDEQRLSILFTRLAGKDQPITAKITVSDYDNDGVASANLVVNHKKLRTLHFSDADVKLTPKETDLILSAVLGTGKVQLTNKDNTLTLSNEGANAVFLKMDDIQGRIATTSAIVKKGTKTEVALAVAMPTIKAKPILSTKVNGLKLDQKEFLKNVMSSELQDTCTVEKLEPEIEAILSKTKLLVTMPCWQGAYNQGNGYWVINKQKPYQPKLVTLDASGLSENELFADQKGRGLGDCWSHDVWTWNGVDFVQTFSSTSGKCQLIHAGGTWELPTIVTKVQ